MVMNSFFKIKDKKGLSAVVTMMIMIVIIIAGTGIIWVAINKNVTENLSGAESCYEAIGKIEINSEYTCYDSFEDEMHFSINVKDFSVEELIVAISDETDSKTFRITNKSRTIDSLRNYDDSTSIKVPGQNSGLTYIAEGFSSQPLKVEIAIVINDKPCDAIDSFSEIYNC